MWTDAQIRFLINERRNNNNEYHNLVCTGKMNFWKGVAVKINREFGTRYSGKQSKEKFQSLVRAYNVSKMYNNLLLLKCHKLIYYIIIC